MSSRPKSQTLFGTDRIEFPECARLRPIDEALKLLEHTIGVAPLHLGCEKPLTSAQGILINDKTIELGPKGAVARLARAGFHLQLWHGGLGWTRNECPRQGKERPCMFS